MPTPTPTPRDTRPLAAAAMLIVAITVTLAGLLVSSYHDTIEREQTNLRNLAEAFAAQTHYATLALDLALARAAEHAPQDGTDTAAVLSGGAPEAIPARVRRLGPDAPRRPQPSGAPKIGIALPPGGGPAAITLARVLPDGPAVIEADAAYFQRIFDSADLGHGGSVTLHQRDGTMLVRSPTLPKAIGHSFIHTPLFQTHLPRASVGAFEATSPIDGVRRLYGYSAVAGYPLLIVAGRDLADTLAVWRGWLWIAMLAWVLLSVTLAVLAWRMSREAARQAALIARLQASERRLADGARYLDAILDSLATPLWVLDAKRRIVLFNRAFLQFTGRTGDAVTGHLEAEVLDPAGAGARARLYADSTADGAGDGVHALEAEIRDGSGATRTAIQLAAQLRSEGDAVQIVNSLTDITERKQVELRLAYLADHDPLTGLPNLNRLRRVLADALQGEQVVLLLIALERQQEVADLLGIEAGDDAVRQVAARFDALAPAALCVARVKANEFAVLLPAGPGHRPVDAIALELHALLSEPVRVGGREFHLAPVIGIATYPQDAASANELMRLADIAKHRARSEAGEPVHFHSESTHIQLDERLTIEEQLRHALARGELTPHYQPKVDIATGQVTGFEVLLRWNSPVLGPVSPARFIPIAEQTGLIIPIGTWVLRTACAQASRWAREHGIATRIAVNLSIRQFYQKDLLKVIADALADAGLAPHALELEITESIAMSRVDVVERLLGGIRDLGVELSIDDFGTGYSSLAYLKRFPVQRLKVDRAFVRDLGRDADSAAIVRSVVALGHGLSMRIVAEGVETEEQLALLRALGCDEYQGFLFARPMDAAAVPALLGRPVTSGA
ncbi:EAL domain-containing protein [Telluria mixta]|uniref:EAL domain-containing protein n=1 Tax=Telluria mixta TaxID=34071 RepID=A0ABT2C972_9BURK|nr:EAL domain-containing protein [Telluria mixta]MCS0633927.1 EAL domain-containing protein [Telluria mixta]WEM95541.1 EAL domain-containing protein [Telluria mixta]